MCCSNTLSHSGLASVNIRKRMFYPLIVGLMYVKQLCVPEYSSVELEVSSKYVAIYYLFTLYSIGYF